MVSALDKAKRALVSLLRILAAARNFAMRVDRNSSDKDVASAFRKLSAKVHPDKPGGNASEQKRLNAAYAVWQKELQKAPGSGGPRKASPASAAVPLVPEGLPPKTRAEFRIQSVAVLLTFQGFGGAEQWERFVSFVQTSKAQ